MAFHQAVDWNLAFGRKVLQICRLPIRQGVGLVAWQLQYRKILVLARANYRCDMGIRLQVGRGPTRQVIGTGTLSSERANSSNMQSKLIEPHGIEIYR